MPGIASLTSSSLNVLPEHIPLWLPSSLDPPQRGEGFCSKGLAEKERQLRFAECEDLLDIIRGLLRSRGALILTRNNEYRGQRQNTRAQQTFH